MLATKIRGLMMDVSMHGGADALPEIPGYRLLRLLGRGGMSTIYLAQQPALDRQVAIKVIKRDALSDEVGRRRFESEARTIARLDHPHIVRIHEIGHTRDGLPYYVMPLLAHGHLGKRNLVGQESKVREVLEALLSALGYAHRRGVIHRDVKAENVMFDEAERPMLTDFGIALRRGYGARITSAGVAIGSTAYMSPEQARGGDVDLRADLYSLGVLAWEILTGDLPYKASDGLSMALKHVQDPIPRLPAHLAHWQHFFDTALAKSPVDRYVDAAAMTAALREIPHSDLQPVRAALMRLRNRIRPRQLLMAGGLAVAGITAVVLLSSHPAPTTPVTPVVSQVQPADTAVDNTGPDIELGAPVPDPGDALHRAPPDSAALPYLTAARRQLAQQQLIQPSNGNAHDSLMMAWRMDPSHPELPPLTLQTVAALGTLTERKLGAGDDATAANAFERMRTLAEKSREESAALLSKTRKRCSVILSDRMRTALMKQDRSSAKNVLGIAKSLGVEPAALAALQADYRRIGPGAQPAIAANANATTIRSEGRTIAVAHNLIHRELYAEFAKSTQRDAALCRERVSLLRVLAPRNWQQPGFEQGNADAVVCVSWQDAQAFAQWLSQRDRQRYRLPTAAEAQAVARGTGGRKALAEWVADCAGRNCARRRSAGRGWRGAGNRALDVQRGYDDVGFRLVSEL